MKRFILLILLIICGLLATERVCAQYYSWGTDPTSFNWRQIKGNKYRIVYPDTAQNVASRMSLYLDAINNDISYGYRHRQMSIPFVVHPANMMSNGLVMWLPKRVEFLSSPAISGYSMPWTKQLVAHEYRHAVQYNNLNKGFVKILSYLIGQQSSTIGLLFMPLWMMEGDAVMSETEMSTFGRGLQPSFSIEYRAYGDVAGAFKNRDKWFCGSFKDYIPDHYQLGYQICRYGYNKYGRILGNDMAELTTRRPYMVVSNSWIFNKLYGVSQSELFDDTFNTLHQHWESLPKIKQSTDHISIPKPECFTKYTHPMALGDGTILALKEDLDQTSAFVVIDPKTGNERHLTFTGMVSSRPALSSTGRVWWTEYRRSLVFAEKISSQIYYLDIGDNKPKRLRQKGNIIFATPTEDNTLAWVEYGYDGSYSVTTYSLGRVRRRTTIEQGKEVHGMAWDNATKRLYLLITDDDGMHIAHLNEGKLQKVTRPAYTTLSDLRAKDGKLYYGSIASGRDELHAYDIVQGKEYQLSMSTYGSFSPAPYDENNVVGTSFDKRGYLPVLQRTDSAKEISYRPHPEAILLPKSKPWGVVNLDTVRFGKITADSLTKSKPTRRFSRFGHAFNIHSWAPASYDPYALTEESKISFNLGATIMSQNILSTMEGFLTWGWNQEEGSIFKGALRYYGLGVNLWAQGTYGGTQKVHKVYIYDPETKELIFPDEPKLDRYYSLSAGATLPLLFQRGYHTSQLTLSASWTFTNGMTANIDNIDWSSSHISNIKKIGYTEGVHQLSFGVGFSDEARMAHRDFLPPWGTSLSASYTLNPRTNDFGHLIVLYGKILTPGFGKHHSLSLAASYQTSVGGFHSDIMLSDLAFKSTKLLPRGFSSYDINNNNYIATSLNYQLPIWYPDGGWSGVIYFKRLRLNLGVDYASFNQPSFNTSTGTIIEPRHKIWAYGGDIIVDFNLFSLPKSATITATLSLYCKGSTMPLQNNKLHVAFGLGLPF